MDVKCIDAEMTKREMTTYTSATINDRYSITRIAETASEDANAVDAGRPVRRDSGCISGDATRRCIALERRRGRRCNGVSVKS